LIGKVRVRLQKRTLASTRQIDEFDDLLYETTISSVRRRWRAGQGTFVLQSRERATFDAAELAVVLSHFDLGVLESITDFPRGSRKSPKVGIVCERGKFLLKRRSTTRAHPERVHLAHRVQALLTATRFPLPRLISARDGATMLHLRDHLYELFEFVAGHPFEHSVEESRDGGETLAWFHQVTSPIPKLEELPLARGDYHDATGIRTGLCAIGGMLKSHDSFVGQEAELGPLTSELLASYDKWSELATQRGVTQYPPHLIHADWHPGNILFRQRKVVAVVDYDSLRLSKRIIDVANGALQFSIMAGGDPVTWPDHPDEGRYRAFLEGYEARWPLTPEERNCLPPLMAEALISECVPPIAETGSVGPWAGFRVLQMVRRKLTWLAENEHMLLRDSSGP